MAYWYCVSKEDLTDLAAGRKKLSEILVFANEAIITYTGQDVMDQAGRPATPDEMDKISDAVATDQLGEDFAAAVQDNVVKRPLSEPNR